MGDIPAVLPGGMQFDRAELQSDSSAELVCKGCNRPIAQMYYAAGDKILCRACRDTVQRTLDAGGIGPFLKAIALGVPAAVFGAVLYYAVRALTGYEFGLMAIVIGVLVGGAVRRGSGGRGGWAYQSLAVLLTYCTIVSTYVPYLIEGARRHAQEQRQTATAAPAQDGQSAPAAEPASASDAIHAEATAPQPQPASPALALLLLVGIVLALPFLAGIQNIMGIVILGIGLYEAWKINKRPAILITGPYQLAAAVPQVSA